MPLGIGALPARIALTIQDKDSNTSEAIRYVPGIVTIADAVLLAAAFEAVVAPLTNGFIVGGSLSIPLVQSTEFAAPPPESDVERKGVFSFALDNGNSVRYTIPSLANTLVTTGSRGGDIDAAQLAVAAYATLMTTGVNGNNLPIERLVRAFKRHKASGRGGA